MEGLSRRFESTSRNLANANTPEYARRNVSFEDQLREVVDGPRSLPMTIRTKGTYTGTDGGQRSRSREIKYTMKNSVSTGTMGP